MTDATSLRSPLALAALRERHPGWLVFAVVLLALLLSLLVWSRIAPGEVNLGVATIPNFWSHLTIISILAAVTLFCGWLQGIFHWAPAEINLDPGVPTVGADTAHPHH